MSDASNEAAGNVGAQQTLVKSLHKLAATLEIHLKSPFKYRLISQAQAGPAERAYFNWANAGNTGPVPGVDAASMRAAVYSQAAPARQLDAFLHVSRVAVLELCRVCIQGFEAGEITIPCMMLRSLIERIAHVAALAAALKPLAEIRPSPDKPSEPLIAEADRIGKALYGTKIDWRKLSAVDWRVAKTKDIEYVRKELTMDVSARSVLTAIDKLDKRVPGLRIAYDVLCEFLHPNVGDLYATTVHTYSRTDFHGTRHLIREIGLGPKDLSDTPDLERILSQVLAICSGTLEILPLAFDDLRAASLAANKMAEKFAHRVRKHYRPYFQKDDLCPCLSGLRVKECK